MRKVARAIHAAIPLMVGMGIFVLSRFEPLSRKDEGDE
jgi:hypothetical protein